MNLGAAIAVGVSTGVLASLLFLFGIRTLLRPNIELSPLLAHQLNSLGAEVYRVKIVNGRRMSEAVNIQCELVAMKPLSAQVGRVPGRRRWLFFGERHMHHLQPHKYERTTLPVRPGSMVSIPRFSRRDPEASYAFRITTSECTDIAEALAEHASHVRVRVYAEHPWSGRGKSFTHEYTVPADAVIGDFPLGPEMTVTPDVELAARIDALRASAAPPVPTLDSSAPPK